jgi:hypothetical protein
MRRQTFMTVIMLGLWPHLVMPTSDHAADTAWSVPRLRCDRMPLSRLAPPDVPVNLAQHKPSCRCPNVECEKGTVQGCEADCDPAEQAVCRCEGWCDANGDPRGSNVCECH